MNFDKEIFKNKKIIYSIVSILILTTFLIVNFSLDSDKQTNIETTEAIKGLKVFVNDKEIGNVENRSVIESLLFKIENEIEKSSDSDIVINLDSIRYENTNLNTDSLTQESELENNIKKYIEYSTLCYSINIDGDNIVFLKSKNEAEEVINKIKSMYMPNVNEGDTTEIEYIKILEDTNIKAAKTSPENIMSVDDSIKYLLKGTTEDKIYKVKKGDSLWLIANNNNMTVEDIIQANPEISPTLIHIDDEINLIVPKPYLNIEVKYLHTYNENIPYKTIVKKDSSLERTKSKVEKSGILGKKEVTAEIVMKNGLLDNRTIIIQHIISEPKTRVVVQGTKRLAVDNLAVAFLPEGKGIFTSRFGMRWGRHHDGIDYGVPTGTPVYTIMPGVVKFSGWKSGYGYLVIIDHQNGYETYYGHNSKLLVKAGDKVTMRQKISLSGNTGRSTGPHVHFEIHKNGKLLDPLKYLQGR